MVKKREIFGYAALLIIMVTLAYGSIYLLRATLKTEYPLMVVVSESMVSTLGVGDFILVGNIDNFDDIIAAPRPNGDIIVFVRSEASDDYIVHRAVQKINNGGSWSFVTKGDNNPVPDGQMIPQDQVVGKVVGRVPVLGYFPLFIKTLKGFFLVAAFMVLMFFADDLIPQKSGNPDGYTVGKFPFATIIPFLITPFTLILFWFLPALSPSLQLNLELFALFSWYLASFFSPLAFKDDDVCFMIWLYFFVILILPLGCDVIWRLTDITPSNWWYVQGSTVPITFLFMRETPLFDRVFSMLLLIVSPGLILFFSTMIAKRRGFRFFVDAKHRLRGSSPIDDNVVKDAALNEV